MSRTEASKERSPLGRSGPKGRFQWIFLSFFGVFGFSLGDFIFLGGVLGALESGNLLWGISLFVFDFGNWKKPSTDSAD